MQIFRECGKVWKSEENSTFFDKHKEKNCTFAK